MKKKIDASIWERASKQEIKKALGYGWFLLVFALISTGIIGYLIYMSNLMTMSLDELEISQKLVIIGLLLFAIIFLSSDITSLILELKNIKGKFGIEAIILIPFTLITSGINLFFGTIMSNQVRKRIIRKIKPKFEEKEAVNEEKSLSNEEDLSKALYCLSDAIKLEEASNYKEAYKKYLEAYNLGDGRGAYYLARMYEEGRGLRKDINESLRWEKKAADKDVSLSQYYIGLEYIKGENVPKNEEVGMAYLEQSALQNEYDACFYLGIKHGSDLNKKYFDLKKAENYLIRAVKAAENDEEVGEALNELGRLWIGLWGETYELEHYKMALQLFKKAKSYDNADAVDNYKSALELRLPKYPSEAELVNDWLVYSYLNSVKFEVNEKVNDEEEKSEVETFEEEKSVNESINEERAVYNPEVEELKSLRSGLLISSIIKLIFFGAGLFIVLYGVNNSPNLAFLSPFVVIGGVVVGGLPGLPKAFNDSYNYNKKWDKFFGRADYKATIDLDKRTVKVRKNDDWMSIIFITLMNLLKTAMAAPFEALRDFWRVYKISGKIKEY